MSVYDIWQTIADMMEMRNHWDAAMQEAGLDALVFPALPLPAMPHGMPGELTAPLSYMFVSNLLQWPCGTLPVTTVEEGEDRYDLEDLPEHQRDPFAHMAQKVMTGSVGLPVSVSVMAPAFQDEKCLGVMKQIEQLVGFDKEPTAYLHR